MVEKNRRGRRERSAKKSQERSERESDKIVVIKRDDRKKKETHKQQSVEPEPVVERPQPMKSEDEISAISPNFGQAMLNAEGSVVFSYSSNL